MREKRTLKRVLVITLCVALLLTSLPMSVFAVSFDDSAINGYYNIISKNEYNLAPGATETELVVNNATGDDRKVVHVFEVDTQNENVEVLPGYYGIDKLDPTNLKDDTYWTDKKLTETVKYYEDKLGYNVVGAMNTALAYDSNAPYGYMVWDGVVLGTPEVHPGSQTYLAVNNDGTCELRSMSTPLTGNEKTAISANFGWLVKDGVLTSTSVERTSSDASRSMIGIKADGTLVFCQVDGRNAPISTGLSNYEMGEMMLALGCVNAVNCDGGGSSTFVSKREGTTENVMRSVPSDGSERPTINSVIIVSKAQATGVFDHAVVKSEYDYYAPGATGHFNLVGVDASGSPAELPTEGLSWSLSDDSFGTIADGTFVSNGTKGKVNIQINYNGKVVGEKTIEIVEPASFGFTATETVIPYGKSVDVEVVATYGADDFAVGLTGAYELALSNDSAATLVGKTVTATDDTAVSGVDVIATALYKEGVTSTLKVKFGKGSDVIFNFEDGDVSSWMGFVDAKQWCIDNNVNNTLVGTNPLDGQYSEEVNGWTSLASKTNGGKVKNGKYALAWTLDNTDANFAQWTYNVLFNVGESVVLRDTANGNNATRLGMWLYIPEGVAGMAFQSQLYTKTADGGLTHAQTHFTFTTANGTVKNLNSCTEADIPESRWVYASIDLTGYNYLQTPDADYVGNNRTPSIIRTYVKPTEPGVYTFYIDDITLDYSDAVEDRVLPVISNPKYATQDESVDLNNEATINGNKVSFSATINDNQAIDNATGKIYLDGNELSNAQVSGKIISAENIVLTSGVHKIAFEVQDKTGNLARVTRTFTISGDALITLSGHNESGAAAETGSVYYADLFSTANVDKLKATIALQSANTWEPEGIRVAAGYEAEYTLDSLNNEVTVTVTRVNDAEYDAEIPVVSIPIRVWSWNTTNKVTGAVIEPETHYATGNCPIVTIEYEVVNGQVDFISDDYDNYNKAFGGQMSVETKINDIVNPWHYHETVELEDVEATCTVDGYKDRTYCEGCKSVINWGTLIKATGHEYGFVEGILKCKNNNCDSLFNGEYDDEKLYVDGIPANGWVGDSYCVEGEMVVGIQKIEDCYYDFGEDGICEGKVKYTGLLYDADSYYYAIAGTPVSGWHNIDGKWHYFRSSTKKAAFGKVTCQISGTYITYTFNEDGTLAYEPWIETEEGWKYFYGPANYVRTWATIDGEEYYFGENGCRYTGYQLIKDSRYSTSDDYRLYMFAEDGILVETSTGNGLLVTEDGTFYLENGYAKYKGLVKIDGDYYYFNSSRKAVTGEYTISLTNNLLPAGTYTFDNTGKMVVEKKNGVIGDYYYVDGIIQMTGLTKVGDDYYYFSTTNGKMRKNVTSVVNVTCCDLPTGTYTFGADGKVIIEKKNGVIGDYYYVDGIIQMTGLTKVGDDYYYFSTTNGKMRKNVTSVVNVTCCDLPTGTYTFGADGKVIIEKKNGVIGDYYYVDGIIQMTGLTKVEDDYYYFSTTNGKMRKNVTSVVNVTCCDLPTGTYTFGADGKVVIEEVDGIINGYYYIDGVIQKGGLTKVGDDYYYFSTTNGKMSTNVTKRIYFTCCDLPVGVYTFGADGKVVL